MKDLRKHDYLAFNKDRLFSVANHCYLDKKIIISGFLFVNALNADLIWIKSDTGYEYLIQVPDFMQNKKFASQFNVSFPFKEVRFNNL